MNILGFALLICLQPGNNPFRDVVFDHVYNYLDGSCRVSVDGSTYTRYMTVKDFGFTEIYRWNGEQGYLFNLWPGDRLRVLFMDDGFGSDAQMIKLGCKTAVENTDFIRIEEEWVLKHLKPKKVRKDYEIRLALLDAPRLKDRELGEQIILGMKRAEALRLLVHGQYFYAKRPEIQYRIASLFHRFNISQGVLTWSYEVHAGFRSYIRGIGRALFPY